MSSNNKPTPYAFAPTKDGRKLPWELGRPDVGRQLEPVPTGPRASTATDDHSSTAESSASPSPFRPGRAFDMWREQRAQPVPEQNLPEQQPIAEEPQEAPPARPHICTCQMCPARMPTRAEKKCCMQEDLAKTFFADYREGVCLSTYAEVRHNLHPISVRTSWLSQQQYLGRYDALSFDNMDNNNYRYHAYRNYVKYIHGLLGRFQRKVVPACIVKVIRDTWPSADGTYRGFIAVTEDGQPIEVPEDYDELEELQQEQM